MIQAPHCSIIGSVSDEELMERLKNRDETALHEFRVRFGGVIRTIVDETLVEETTQTTSCTTHFSRFGSGRLITRARAAGPSTGSSQRPVARRSIECADANPTVARWSTSKRKPRK